MTAEDTAPEAAAVLLAGWQAMSTLQRMQLVDAWSRDVRALAEAGVRARHGAADAVQVRLHLARVLYGAQVIDADVEAAMRAVR